MRIHVPGDKSLTQRALILAALARGRSRLSGLLFGGDAASTAGALARLGVPMPPLPQDGRAVDVEGVGLEGLEVPADVLDLGNSGTGTRLLLGVLAGSAFEATLDGDDSLRTRPMARVTEPLTAMGASFAFLRESGRLPLTVRGARPLKPLMWESPVASAQVKSALLLAGLVGGAWVSVREPRRSRDHTERLLNACGVTVVAHPVEGRWQVELRDPPETIRPLDFHVPGDLSSAAFFLALGALGGGGREGVEVASVGLNPTRTAFLDVLRRMGASVTVSPDHEDTPEPAGTIIARPGELRATTVQDDEVPGLIDEIPLIAVLAARASGETRITGAADLRHKESDRIRTVVENLRAVGADAEELPDGMVVAGSDRPLRGRVTCHGDHRIAMAFGVLGAAPGCDVVVDEPHAASVSFPGFWPLLERVRGAGGTT